MQMACKTCCFGGAVKEVLRCKRNAPVATLRVIQESETYVYVPTWPAVEENDWCGEWRCHFPQEQLSRTGEKP